MSGTLKKNIYVPTKELSHQKFKHRLLSRSIPPTEFNVPSPKLLQVFYGTSLSLILARAYIIFRFEDKFEFNADGRG